MFVSLNYSVVYGVLVYLSIVVLLKVFDFVVICINKNILINIINELGEFGCKYVVVIVVGLNVE